MNSLMESPHLILMGGMLASGAALIVHGAATQNTCVLFICDGNALGAEFLDLPTL